MCVEDIARGLRKGLLYIVLGGNVVDMANSIIHLALRKGYRTMFYLGWVGLRK